MTGMAFTSWLRTRMIVRAAVVAVALGLVAAAASESASAAVRFSDGAYARTVIACKASTPNMLQSATYANRSGISARIRYFTYYANSRNVNAWSNWTPFAQVPSGRDYSPDTINALPDGKYVFQIQYARKINGAWSYFSEYIPVFQYSDGWANMPVILGGAQLPNNNECVLGMSQIVISYG